MDNAAATAMSPAAAPCVSRASGWPFVWLMAALVLAEFLTSLDNTLVTTASPVIVKQKYGFLFRDFGLLQGSCTSWGT
ncbi:hypothetical protein HDU89_002948 [Geranomyces variabilis]|nr:hypothetical protein HDU89_002948 [Geranomyces variabilis]